MAEEAADVNEPVEAETTATESSTEKTNDDGIIASDESSLSEPVATEDGEGEKKSEENTDDDQSSKTSDTNQETKPKNAETRKQQLNNEIRDKIAERNALREEIAELNKQKYQMKTQEDLPTVDNLMEQIDPETGDYYTRTDAKLARIEAERELERAQKQMDEYVDRIVDNRLSLKEEADRALKDFPMFDEQSSSYNEELAKQADQIANGLIVKDEQTGEIIGSRGSIYDVYATIANAAQSAETSGKIAGRKAAVDMMNSADVVGSNSTGTIDNDDDPFLKGFKKTTYQS